MSCRPHHAYIRAHLVESDVAFQVSGRTAFELPLSAIANSNIAGKNEVALEFNPPPPLAHDPRDLSKRPPDDLVEMRFYIPGMAMREKDDEADAGEDAEDDIEKDEDGNEMSAAEAFHNTIKDKADLGAVVGDCVVKFDDVLVLTPRFVESVRSKLCSLDNRDQSPLTPAEVDSRLSCIKSHYAWSAKAQTTEYPSKTSIACFSSRKSTRCTCSSYSASIRPFGRAQHGIRSWWRKF